MAMHNTKERERERELLFKKAKQHFNLEAI